MTILIAGGTGTLGTEVVRLLTARDLPVRILTRDPKRAGHLVGERVEVVAGDVRDGEAVARAVAGTRTVISAIHGFTGEGGDNPRTIDAEGNGNLIHAAQTGGVEHFILLSVQGAAPDHPMELFRRKYEAEQALQASELAWTILRPTAYMETWAKIVGEPLVKTGKTTIFGRGNNAINFVSVHDVARFVELAVTDPAVRGDIIEVGGPENLTMRQMMRAMAVLLRPVKPEIARQIQAGVVMDTRDMRFDAAETARRYPGIPQTRLEEMVRRDYAPVV
jgi:uncharacterized protein YbjT (DUF2867 family)